MVYGVIRHQTDRIQDMANRSKAKGSRGEFEILDLLQTVVNEEYARVRRTPPELSRGTHGRDIVGLPWLAPEVKRVEQNNPSNVASWWAQCKDQATRAPTSLTPVTGFVRDPVLFYRQNNRPWNVRMFGFLEVAGHKDRVRCPVDTTIEAFSAWFRIRLRADLVLDVRQVVGLFP